MNSEKKYPPIHGHYNFAYRNIFPYIRDYESIAIPTLLTQINILDELNLTNDFTRAYIEYNHDTNKIQEFWQTWNSKRKTAIHTLIYNGANANLYLVKKSYITIEYMKLLAWAYSPLPPHILLRKE